MFSHWGIILWVPGISNVMAICHWCLCSLADQLIAPYHQILTLYAALRIYVVVVTCLLWEWHQNQKCYFRLGSLLHVMCYFWACICSTPQRTLGQITKWGHRVLFIFHSFFSLKTISLCKQFSPDVYTRLCLIF